MARPAESVVDGSRASAKDLPAIDRLLRDAATLVAAHGRTLATAEARALLDAPEESLPASWKEMADLGWMGLHLPEALGGSGFGLAELVIVVEALGAAVAPGPFLPTVWASPTARCPRRSVSTNRAAWCSAPVSPSCSCSPAVTTTSLRTARR